RGLMAAHEKGLVHRDFKPDNVMVGKDAQVRVMDFGLARQVNEPAVGTPPEGATAAPRAPGALAEAGAPPELDPMTTVVLNIPVSGSRQDSPQPAGGSTMFNLQLTRTGAMMGTPAYMAPEQFLGTPTDARTDQFSFCVALYESLYGERPFSGNTMFALTSNVVQGNVRDPPASSKVPLWVRKVLLRGLRPQAAERWPSMAELLEALGKNPSAKWNLWGGVAVGVLGLAALVF